MTTATDHTYVVIMAGGGGTRLWPHSRRLRPKQFLPMLPGGETLLSATVRRTLPTCPIERTLVVTAAEQVAQVRRCVPDLPIDNIVVEPLGRNTAPCVGLAALAVARRDPAAIMAVLPSDHHVKDEAGFGQVLRDALGVAAHGHVVTVGVVPARPETGYGYIHVGPADPAGGPLTGTGVHLAESFVEKPDLPRARHYVESGSYRWNAGMFFFPARRILAELRQKAPDIGALLDELWEHPERTPARYPEARAISIDYAVMEKLGRDRAGAEACIRVVSGDFGWDDVGSFSALSDLHQADDAGNHVVPGRVQPVLLRASGNLVWNDTGKLCALVGVHDLVVAVTDDAVLVISREGAQEVRDVVAILKESSRSEYL